jgi:hypothetical protein
VGTNHHGHLAAAAPAKPSSFGILRPGALDHDQSVETLSHHLGHGRHLKKKAMAVRQPVNALGSNNSLDAPTRPGESHAICRHHGHHRIEPPHGRRSPGAAATCAAAHTPETVRSFAICGGEDRAGRRCAALPLVHLAREDRRHDKPSGCCRPSGSSLSLARLSSDVQRAIRYTCAPTLLCRATIDYSSWLPITPGSLAPLAGR